MPFRFNMQRVIDYCEQLEEEAKVRHEVARIMRLKLLLAYVGTDFSGWQIQEKPNPPRTVQGVLEAALRTLTGDAVRVYGAGRTDSGVHAHGQVAHCDVPDSKAGLDWRKSLNSLLPKDICILDAARAAPTFHARNDAVGKTYAYRFWQERAFVPPYLVPFVWCCGPLDMRPMRAALPSLIGRHDFAGLQNAGTDTNSTHRTLFSAEIAVLPPCAQYPPHAPSLCLTVSANGFLKQMVRNIAGLLVACGRQKIAPEDVDSLLAACDRRAVNAQTAPAQGLSLVNVDYGTVHTIK
jgi:tRNA pseudouridine38-40 synthase